MKKLLAMLLAVVISMALIACGKQSGAGEYKEGELRMLNNYLSGDTSSSTKDGYYEVRYKSNGEGSNLLYTDYATKQQVVLCNRPECKHDDDSCTSWVQDSSYYVFVIGEKIYWETYNYNMLAGNMNGEPETSLYSADLNGANRKEVLKLQGSNFYSSATDGKNVFFTQQETEGSYDDPNNPPTITTNLMKLDLSTGSVEKIKSYSDYTPIVDVAEGKLVMQHITYKDVPAEEMDFGEAASVVVEEVIEQEEPVSESVVNSEVSDTESVPADSESITEEESGAEVEMPETYQMPDTIKLVLTSLDGSEEEIMSTKAEEMTGTFYQNKIYNMDYETGKLEIVDLKSGDKNVLIEDFAKEAGITLASEKEDATDESETAKSSEISGGGVVMGPNGESYTVIQEQDYYAHFYLSNILGDKIIIFFVEGNYSQDTMPTERSFAVDQETGKIEELTLKMESKNTKEDDEAVSAARDGMGYYGIGDQPIRVLATIGDNFLVSCAYSTRMEGSGADAWPIDTEIYGLISQEDYFANKPNYQMIEMAQI